MRKTAGAATGLVACFCLFLAPSLAAGPVGVFMQFEVAPSPSVLAGMQEEVGRILDPLGLRFDWRLAAQNRGTELFDRVILLRFEGTCSASPAAHLAPGANIALGETALSGGTVIPYSTVHCLALRSFLFTDMPADGRRDGQMGRAMGRVVAHEFVHALLRTRSHTLHGVVRARHSPRDLVENLDPFCRGERKKLRGDLQKIAGGVAASRAIEPQR